VGYALKRAQVALHAAMAAALEPDGLSVPQYACLELLARRPGASGAELARDAFVSRQAMHQLLAGLRAEGLVAAADGPPGARGAMPVRLTDAGRDRLRPAAGAVAAVEERMVAGLSPTARAALLRALRACEAALSPVAGIGRPDRPAAGDIRGRSGVQARGSAQRR